jgi:hypothetical protein
VEELESKLKACPKASWDDAYCNDNLVNDITTGHNSYTYLTVTPSQLSELVSRLLAKQQKELEEKESQHRVDFFKEHNELMRDFATLKVQHERMYGEQLELQCQYAKLAQSVAKLTKRI